MSTEIESVERREPAACCSPAKQETCCEPSEKSLCCGPAQTSGACGCQ